MFERFGFGATEVTVILIVGLFVWGLRVLATITKTPTLSDHARNSNANTPTKVRNDPSNV